MSYTARILLIPASAEWIELIDAGQQTRMWIDFYLCLILKKKKKNSFGFFVECYLWGKKRLQCAVR